MLAQDQAFDMRPMNKSEIEGRVLDITNGDDETSGLVSQHFTWSTDLELKKPWGSPLIGFGFPRVFLFTSVRR